MSLVEPLELRRLLSFAVAMAVMAMPSFAGAQYINVYGAPTSYGAWVLPVGPGSTVGNGTAVGSATKSTGGTRAIRWDASGSAATELGNLGGTNSQAYAVSTAGTAVGSADKYTGGTELGKRAVRWNASGSAATELGNLGTDVSGYTYSEAYAINTAGAAVGYAYKYNGGGGTRAVRWDAWGTAATELGNIGTDSGGLTFSHAYAINTAGTAVGYAEKRSADHEYGTRAVRWDASGTAATELDPLSTFGIGTGYGIAYAVNAAGTAVGTSTKFVQFQGNLGDRAVRWDASGTAATELGNLGTNSSGNTNCIAYAVNTAGTAVGYAVTYNGDTFTGARAVRWDGSGSAATELGNLGTDGSSGNSDSRAYAVNAAGIAVGSALKYTDGVLVNSRAVLWNFDAVAIDLNTLIDPASGWTRPFVARGISDTNWVSGVGLYDPDGAGPLGAYDRAFLMNVSSAVPEPTGLALLALGLPLLVRRGVRRSGTEARPAPLQRRIQEVDRFDGGRTEVRDVKKVAGEAYRQASSSPARHRRGARSARRDGCPFMIPQTDSFSQRRSMKSHRTTGSLCFEQLEKRRMLSSTLDAVLEEDYTPVPAVEEVVASSPALAAPVSSDHQVPFKGSLQGDVTIIGQPPIFTVNISATGNASHLGRFVLSIPHTVNRPTGTAFGTYDFVAANGDELTASFTGQSAPTATPGVIAIVEHATITGGTGRFTDASGSFVCERLFDTIHSTTAGSFVGTVSSPGAAKH